MNRIILLGLPVSKNEVHDLIVLEESEIDSCGESALDSVILDQKQRRLDAINDFSDSQKLDFYQIYGQLKKDYQSNKVCDKKEVIYAEPKYTPVPKIEIRPQAVKGSPSPFKMCIAVLNGIFILCAFSFALYQCSKPKSPHELARKSEEAAQLDSIGAVRASLKDPDSAEFRNIRGICGEVNSKNGFGGMSGFKRYVGNSEIVAIDGENIDSEQFQLVWDRFCH